MKYPYNKNIIEALLDIEQRLANDKRVGIGEDIHIVYLLALVRTYRNTLQEIKNALEKLGENNV